MSEVTAASSTEMHPEHVRELVPDIADLGLPHGWSRGSGEKPFLAYFAQTLKGLPLVKLLKCSDHVEVLFRR